MKTILVPTDFSSCAVDGLRYATHLAIQTQSRLIVVHSLDLVPEAPAGGTLPGDPYAQPAEAAQLRLDQLCAQLRSEHPQLQHLVETVVRYENPTPAIARVAREKGVDLIVMGTSGAEGVFSSVAAEVIEEASCPVLAVPAGTATGPVNQIVFATAFTDSSPDLSIVTDLAGLWNVPITVMHVLDGHKAEEKAKAEAKLRKIAGKLSYGNVSLHLEENADVEKGISAYISRTGTSLLVMEYHTRSWWQQLLRDSHIRQMAYHIRIPLLAIR